MRNMGGWISPLWAFEGEKYICFSGFFKSMNSAKRAQLILEPFTSIHSYIPLVIITYAHKSNLRQEGNILSQSLRCSLAQQGSRGSRIWGEPVPSHPQSGTKRQGWLHATAWFPVCILCRFKILCPGNNPIHH